MVSYNAVDSLIIGDGIAWSELDDNFFISIFWDGSFCLIEGKYVIWIDKKLKISIEL